ncbi:hypothetical protein ALI22I_20580 [Saccharothrix sp. ALI-22-I]|uniref:hypothetical protein n=1 Tax=Saccharothrix sp. ALI-22-I TaxID=1933778 RepID=UPI00097C782F|nr:hypothetical protein [Saccharothrix sp. ALI-22-I]ONI88136.1 hypothetical protein ALI22I_20580 [Saccharothrix sp. ALI-22-I]
MPENLTDLVRAEFATTKADVEPPATRIHDGVLVCPACGARNQLHEVDIAIRFNPMEATGPDSMLVSLQDINFEHLGFICLACRTPVSTHVEVDYI